MVEQTNQQASSGKRKQQQGAPNLVLADLSSPMIASLDKTETRAKLATDSLLEITYKVIAPLSSDDVNTKETSRSLSMCLAVVLYDSVPDFEGVTITGELTNKLSKVWCDEPPGTITTPN